MRSILSFAPSAPHLGFGGPENGRNGHFATGPSVANIDQNKYTIPCPHVGRAAVWKLTDEQLSLHLLAVKFVQVFRLRVT